MGAILSVLQAAAEWIWDKCKKAWKYLTQAISNLKELLKQLKLKLSWKSEHKQTITATADTLLVQARAARIVVQAEGNAQVNIVHSSTIEAVAELGQIAEDFEQTATQAKQIADKLKTITGRVEDARGREDIAGFTAAAKELFELTQSPQAVF